MAIDILIVAILLAALITGAISGLVRQLGTLVAFAVAILACRFFGSTCVSLCGAQSAVATGACYVALFIVAFVLVMIVARLLHTTVRALKLGAVNSILGAVFRLLLWGVVLSACVNAWFAIMPEQRQTFIRHDKPWREWVVKAAPTVVGYINLEENQ